MPSQDYLKKYNNKLKKYKNNTLKTKCICGKTLILVTAKDAYKLTKGIICDCCDQVWKGDYQVLHCPYHSINPDRGYDRCVVCPSTHQRWKYRF